MFFLRMVAAGIMGALERFLYRTVAFLATSLTVSLALALVVSLVCRGLVHLAEGRLDERWRETLGPFSTLPEQLAPRQANQAALDLEVQAARIGLDLSPAQRPQLPMPDAAVRERLLALEESLDVFSRSLVSAEATPPLPADLSRFLTDLQDPLQQVVVLLFQSSEVRWEQDITRGEKAPRPNLTQLLRLHQLLIADAVQRWSDGDGKSATIVLEASRRLNQPIMQRREVASYLTSLEVLRLQLAVARKALPAPLEWIPYLEEQLDLEPHYLQALQTDAWTALRASRQVRLFNIGPPWARHLVHPTLRPFERWAMVDHAEVVRQGVARLPGLVPAEIDRAELAGDLHSLLPRWNRRGHRALADIGGGWLQTERLSLGVELTRHVLGVRKTIELAEDRYLMVLPELVGVRESLLIDGYAWQFTTGSNHLTITLNGSPIEVQDSELATLPLQVTLHFASPIASLRRSR